jgi:isoquinoline 1-oxidoreductase subunit beta
VESRPETWLTRRTLIQLASAAGVTGIVGLKLTAPAGAQGAAQSDLAAVMAAYVAVTPQGKVRFTCPAADIGQGASTALAQILADEMDVSWDSLEVVLAGAGEVFANPGKKSQSVGQSYSIRGYHDQLRLVGAAAREMLLTAGAARLGVAVETCSLESMAVRHAGSNRSIALALLAEDAARLTPPASPRLKTAAQQKLVGKSLGRVDAPAKINGSAIYALDVVVPSMLCAAMAQAPVAGGALASFDHAAAKAMPGVRAVIETKQGLGPGIAVLADRWWQARQALDAGNPQFTGSPVKSADLAATIRDGLQRPGLAVLKTGEPAAALLASATPVDAVYEVPFLAHATMEPMTAVADVTDGGCTLWASVQSQTRIRDELAKLLNCPPAKVVINSVPGGGGFGRRWYPDYPLIAAELSQAAGRPVKLIFSREQDMAHDMYRPAFALRGRAAVSKGRLVALDLALAGPSISEFGRPGRLKGAADPVAVSGLRDLPYKVPAVAVTWTSTPTPVPIGVWRSVGHSHNGFFLESVIDEAAKAAKTDPLAFRLTMLDYDPRAVAVLKAVAKAARWGRKLPKGRGQGLAFAESYGSYLAQIVEVSIVDKALKLEHVWSAIDCGRAINPRGVETQTESAIIYGLGAALWGEVGFEDGAAQVSNFSDYRVPLVRDMPPISVEIVTSATTLDGSQLGGAGEPGLVPIAAALTNAIAAATGTRIRRLPVTSAGWDLA